MYPPRNVRKPKKGSHKNCTALKLKRVPILPETFANPKKANPCTEVKKEYLSSQKRSQIQKRFAKQIPALKSKRSTYPPRNVHKSKKGSHNKCMYPLYPGKSLHDNCTVLIMMIIIIMSMYTHPGMFANP